MTTEELREATATAVTRSLVSNLDDPVALATLAQAARIVGNEHALRSIVELALTIARSDDAANGQLRADDLLGLATVFEIANGTAAP